MLNFKKEIRDYVAWAIVSGLAIFSFGLIFYYMDLVNIDIEKISKETVMSFRTSFKSYNYKYAQYFDNVSSSNENIVISDEEFQEKIKEKFVGEFNLLADQGTKLKEGSFGKDSIGSYKIVDGIKNYDISVGNNFEVEWNKNLSLYDTPFLSMNKEDVSFLKETSPACALVYDYASNPLFKPNSNCSLSNTINSITKVGKIKTPVLLAGKEVYLFQFILVCCDLGCGDTSEYALGFFDDNSKQFVSFYNLSNEVNCEGNNQIRCEYHKKTCTLTDKSKVVNFFSGLIPKKFSELQFPTKIDLPYSDSYFLKAYEFENDIYPNVFSEGDKIKNSEDLVQSLYKEKNNLYSSYFAISPIGAVSFYDYNPYFLTFYNQKNDEYYNRRVKIYNANIIFNSVASKKLSKQFVLGRPVKGGCGSISGNYLGDEIVNGKEFFNENNLIAVAKTAKGDSIYELKDKANNSFYKETFEMLGNLKKTFESWNITTSSDQSIPVLSKEDYFDSTKNSEYKEYLDSIPFIFWKDEFSNWRMYERAYYWQQRDKMSTAECGKPVIYLYPQIDTNVNVQVAPNGGLTIVDPFYPVGGWNVKATPESVLTNTDGKTYPYLFWEGKAYGMNVPNQGFVLKREEIGKQMTTLLTKLGLNQKETKDFLEFWQPKLEEKDFAFVTFLPQSEFDTLAPIKVSPQPDKVIRVFMIYEPLDNFVKVAPLKIETPTRSGFTVVEWGGRLIENF